MCASVWRVSADGADIKHWLEQLHSNTFEPLTLSVTSARLLMTSCDPNRLIQFDADGDELSRLRLPDYMQPRHAVESPTGTLIISHRDTQLNRDVVSEVNTEGQVLHQFGGSRLIPLNLTSQLGLRFAIDAKGNIFVADTANCRILLLDAELALRRVIIDEHQLNYEKPLCLSYVEKSGQLFVGFHGGIAVFDVLRR